MENDDEYAIVSKKEFLALKKELEKIKKNPLEGSPVGENLQDSIDNLNTSLNSMLEVFKQAAQEMNLEEHDTQLVSKQIGPLQEKIDTLIEQNQKIAKGIVAIADMVREKLEEIEEKTSKIPQAMERSVEKKMFAPELAPLTGGPAPAKMVMPTGMPAFTPQAPGQQMLPSGAGGWPPMGLPGAMPLPEEMGMGGGEGASAGMELGGLPPMPPMPSQGMGGQGASRRSPILGGLLKR